MGVWWITKIRNKTCTPCHWRWVTCRMCKATYSVPLNRSLTRRFPGIGRWYAAFHMCRYYHLLRGINWPWKGQEEKKITIFYTASWNKDWLEKEIDKNTRATYPVIEMIRVEHMPTSFIVGILPSQAICLPITTTRNRMQISKGNDIYPE